MRIWKFTPAAAVAASLGAFAPVDPAHAWPVGLSAAIVTSPLQVETVHRRHWRHHYGYRPHWGYYPRYRAYPRYYARPYYYPSYGYYPRYGYPAYGGYGWGW